jgi:hypothetical protein
VCGVIPCFCLVLVAHSMRPDWYCPSSCAGAPGPWLCCTALCRVCLRQRNTQLAWCLPPLTRGAIRDSPRLESTLMLLLLVVIMVLNAL